MQKLGAPACLNFIVYGNYFNTPAQTEPAEYWVYQ